MIAAQAAILGSTYSMSAKGSESSWWSILIISLASLYLSPQILEETEVSTTIAKAFWYFSSSTISFEPIKLK